jgi:hypothetical protein
MAKKSFQIPESLLNQLNEFTNGFLLIAINDKREFEVYHKTDGVADYMGLVNFADIVSGQMQQSLREDDALDVNDDEEDADSSSRDDDDD